ncbi:hypothetical protein [Seinonella peptonophila]|nr:hypothetical protein [Seinonella peptonophila]
MKLKNVDLEMMERQITALEESLQFQDRHWTWSVLLQLKQSFETLREELEK